MGAGLLGTACGDDPWQVERGVHRHGAETADVRQVRTGQLGLSSVARPWWAAQNTAQNRPTEEQVGQSLPLKFPTHDWLELPGTPASHSLSLWESPRCDRHGRDPPAAPG